MLALSWFALASAIVTSVAGQTLLKGGAAARESFLLSPLASMRR